MEDQGNHLKPYFWWEGVIFIAAIASVGAMIIEFTVGVSHEAEGFLRAVDIIALSLFAADIAWKYNVWRHHHKHNTGFVKHNWLDLVAIIPVFRFLRFSRFARLSRLSRLSKTLRVTKTAGLVKASKASKAVKAAKITDAGKATRLIETEKGASRIEEVIHAAEKGRKGASGVAHGKRVEHGVKDSRGKAKKR